LALDHAVPGQVNPAEAAINNLQKTLSKIADLIPDADLSEASSCETVSRLNTSGASIAGILSGTTVYSGSSADELQKLQTAHNKFDSTFNLADPLEETKVYEDIRDWRSELYNDDSEALSSVLYDSTQSEINFTINNLKTDTAARAASDFCNKNWSAGSTSSIVVTEPKEIAEGVQSTQSADNTPQSTRMGRTYTDPVILDHNRASEEEMTQGRLHKGMSEPVAHSTLRGRPSVRFSPNVSMHVLVT
jgi:hypothetical protein